MAVLFFSAALETGFAQVVSDSAHVLSENSFLDIVRKYHPVVKQGALLVKSAEAGLTRSRSGFDPLLEGNYERKKFGGDFYYSYYNPQVRIPTWYGIEITGGLEEIAGDRVNSESTLGQTSYLGIRIPLLKDLVIDSRRAALQQARSFRSQSVADQALLINDLLFEAIGTYWNWVRDYQLHQNLREQVRVSSDRFRFVKIEYQQGNRPAIDTVEALAQLQQFRFLEQEAWLNFQNSGLAMNNFLWLDNNQPYKLPADVFPEKDASGYALNTGQTADLEVLIAEARMSHPKIMAYRYKLDILDIERKLKFQSLLPKLDFKANLLNKGYNVFSKVDGAFLENNYKYGIGFSLPLRLSEGRGSYRQALIKVTDTELERQQQVRMIENKIRQYYNELLSYRLQVSLNESAYDGYFRLLRGEEIRFRTGESSLFLVNSRENKLLESFQKLAELRAKLNKSAAGLLWAAGQLK